MNTYFFIRLTEDNRPVAGSLVETSGRPPFGKWARFPNKICCGPDGTLAIPTVADNGRSATAVITGVLTTATSANIVLKCAASTSQASLSVNITGTDAAKRATILSAAQQAYAGFATISQSGTDFVASKVQCPAVSFSINLVTP